VIEQTAAFARTIGETTDVVSKEMYSFTDKGGEEVTLRPEFTAGIARAYLSEGWKQYAPLKVATHGPAFRYERPQKGRFRQFHQLDAEVLGAGEPQADIELLAFADQLLSELGIGAGAILNLNTLGDPETRAPGATRCTSISGACAALSDDSSARLERNPLRILDSKAHRTGRSSTARRDRRLPDREAATSSRGDQRARCGGIAGSARRAGARARLLPPHRVRVRHRPARRAGTVLAGGRYDGLIESSAARTRRRSAGRRGSSGWR
jgi:histidyl-tRNA synthetase